LALCVRRKERQSEREREREKETYRKIKARELTYLLIFVLNLYKGEVMMAEEEGQEY
jgi:hypothetical protein